MQSQAWLLSLFEAPDVRIHRVALAIARLVALTHAVDGLADVEHCLAVKVIAVLGNAILNYRGAVDLVERPINR